MTVHFLTQSRKVAENAEVDILRALRVSASLR